MADKFVIDASVAAKWFLQDSFEDHVDLAEEVLLDLLAGEIELHAPRIMSYEVCRLLWKACLSKGPEKRAKRLDKETALECVEAFFELSLPFADTTALEAASAIEMGVRYWKNFYDMTYLHLAEELSCKIITADEKLLRSVPKGFPLQRFVLLTRYREERGKSNAPSARS
ncbi:MAG TPA: type II toxin-antitoxin system VapC family toxin [Thermoanaerobaculia bacterium]|nr:type II toxin-antitoxin system VapC family toxin [Thermoanaerobaculia bacterium]